VVVLQLEVGLALDASAAVAGKNSLPDFAGHGLPLTWEDVREPLIDVEEDVGAAQVSLVPPIAVMQECHDIARFQILVLPNETLSVPPVLPGRGECDEDRGGVFAHSGFHLEVRFQPDRGAAGTNEERPFREKEALAIGPDASVVVVP